MLKHSGIGHNYNSVHDEHKNHTLISGPEPLIDNLKKITGKHLYDQQQAPSLCCRDAANLDLEIYKSKPDAPKPDIYVLQCGCGARHRRLFVDPLKLRMQYVEDKDNA